VISGFAQGDFIDFRAVSFNGVTVGWVQGTGSGTLQASNPNTGAVASIVLLGQYVAGNFTSASDGHGGTVVGDPPVVAQTDLLTSPHST
jgi:hypothetical protein